LAQPNQVLVGEGTRSRTQAAFELRKLGSRRLVGREDETVVYELVV
jgi:class 3 adenylate cyclase